MHVPPEEARFDKEENPKEETKMRHLLVALHVTRIAKTRAYRDARAPTVRARARSAFMSPGLSASTAGGLS